MHDDAPHPPIAGLSLAFIIVAISLAFAGWFVGHGIYNVRSADRFVIVKGVAEREVKADLALWPIQLAVPDDNLALAQSRINQNIAKVRSEEHTSELQSPCNLVCRLLLE